MTSLIKCITFAQRATKQAINVKDWRLNARSRRIKEIAKSWTKGYKVKTAIEMAELYRDFPEIAAKYDNGQRVMWCIWTGIPDRRGRVELEFVPVRAFGM